MGSLSYRYREKGIIGRWLPSLLLLAALFCTGCKALQNHDEGLRDSKLSATARQARQHAGSGVNRDSKAADDPWMSDKAQEIARDLQ
jgi:hypothetical protein